MNEIYSRTEMLIGKAALDKLKSSTVMVVGLGGVGSYAVEALARSGVGRLIAVDSDKVSVSNLNRQLIADTLAVGMPKTEAVRKRVSLIAPECKVETIETFVTKDSAKELPISECDYIVDAIDTVSAKLALAKLSHDLSLPMISSMGTGNKLEPTMLKVADIYKTSVCPLARVMRREAKALGIKKLKVVYSEEEPKRANETLADPESGKPIPASIAFVPGAAGLIIASEVIKDIIKGANG